MKYFISDTHFNDPRFEIMFRERFDSIDEMNQTIIDNINSIVKENDELYHLGDVSIDNKGCNLLSKINCKNLHLIIGNYDDRLRILSKYFKTMKYFDNIKLNNQQSIFLNHYPISGKENYNLDKNTISLVGHIHSLWKIQRGLINVGVDVWNFKPISENKIIFLINAMNNHYDENVFPY